MKRPLLMTALIGLLLAMLAGGWQVLRYRAFTEAPLAVPSEGYRLDIAAGTSVRQVAVELERDGLIDDALLMRVLGRLSGQAGRIQAGEYAVTPGSTPERLLQQLVRGEVMQHALTVVEGWTFRQMMDAVRAHPALRQTLESDDESTLLAALGIDQTHPEGIFLPETYLFPRGTTDVEFLRRANQQLQARLQREWQERAAGSPLKSPYEALILASIIERETGVPAERGKVAGVFVRRLQKGMRLQTDPTVIYGMGDAYQGNIRRRDLLRDTPYNTYTRRGLPPTPIALPSAESIRAALQPEAGNELYFVSRGDGSHAFAATLEEHNRNVRRYILKRSP
jgi:UPF0755 protein